MPDTPSNAPEPIAKRAIGTYLETLGSSAPTPGGGSAAGLVGALGASLGLMVISLSHPDDPTAVRELHDAEEELRSLREAFTSLAEDDERVYQAYRDAAAMPKATPDQKAARRAAMQSALKAAATIPLRACKASVDLAAAIELVQTHGNRHVLSDARIAAICATACFEASRINVEVNLAMIKDEAWVADVRGKLNELATRLQADSAHIRSNWPLGDLDLT